MATDTRPAMKHPAPSRNRVGIGLLSFCLAAPPLAWSIQSIAGYGISSAACYPGDTPRTLPLFAGMSQLLFCINGVALAISACAVLLAHRNWRKTREESGGEAARLIERGEGRTRFLAMCGLMLSIGFFVAITFTSITLLLSPVCR